MPLGETLQKVEHDIRAGDLGKAKSRLHGLIATYPNDLALRKQLGDLYSRLYLPEMAGRYWYLVENKDEQMQAACKRFEAQFHNDAALMLLALKFKGDAGAIQDPYARQVLMDLDRRAREEHRWFSSFRARRQAGEVHPKQQAVTHRGRDLIIKAGCIIIGLIVFLLVSIGLINGALTVMEWLR